MAKSFRYLSQYPLDQNLLRFGDKQNEASKLDYKRYLTIEPNINKWLVKALDYESLSLDNYGTTAALHYKHLSQAMTEVCRCMAGYDERVSQLTSHAQRYWRVFTWTKAVDTPATSVNNKKVCATSGLIGALGSYTYIYPNTDWNLEPIPTIQKLIEVFWTDLGIDHTLSPNARLSFLLTLLGFDWNYIDICKEGLTLLTGSDSDLKLSMVDASVLKAFPARLLLGDVPDQLISKWARLQATCNEDANERNHYKFQSYSCQLPFTLLQAGLVVGRGGGWPLVMQVIYIEALLKIAQNFPINFELALSNFTSNQSYQGDRVELANYFALAADAQTVLAIFNTIEGAMAKASEAWRSARQWLDTTNVESIPNDSEYRLALMSKAINY
jgi:hypothetical protein